MKRLLEWQTAVENTSSSLVPWVSLLPAKSISFQSLLAGRRETLGMRLHEPLQGRVFPQLFIILATFSSVYHYLMVHG